MSTNISKQKRDDLLNKISQIRTFLQNSGDKENASKLLGFLSQIEKDVNGKKYGLVFEEHREDIDDLLEENLPILTEQKDLFIDGGGQMNFLLEGDNLAALQLLEKTHRGKIDVIYIDPPYNTGNKDFIYDDSFVDSTDEFRHSKWLSFMKKRLQIAKNLLSEKGVIFISIDDNEQADLKLICDEIFGEGNFISDIIWNSRKSVSNDAIVSLNHNYTLLYTKNMKEFNLIKHKFKLPDAGDGFANPDNDPRGLWKADPFDSPGIRPNLTYKIVNPNTGTEYWPPDGRCWRTGEIEYNEFLKDNRIVFGKTGNSKPQLKRFLSEAQEKGLTPKSIWDDCGTATNGTQEIQNIFGKKAFDTPKPTDFIRKILQLSTYTGGVAGVSKLACAPLEGVAKDGLPAEARGRLPPPSVTILDFFAGSGTTGHAVLKLNAEDGGNRKFILCTNNENEICRKITYERLKTVITGKRADGTEYSEKYNASLKYFKIDFLKISEKVYYEYAESLLLHIRELVELENAVNFECNEQIAIILTEAELDDFCENQEKVKKCKTIYVGHDVLMSEEQQLLFEKHKIKINVIPNYYYKELGA